MKEIRYVADTTANMPEDFARSYDVKLAPIHVIFDGKDYKEIFEMSIAEFHARLAKAKAEGGALPTSSQPSPAEFVEIYNGLIREGAKHIISIHVTAKSSGTVNSANIAKGMVSGAEIHVVDSGFTSMLIGYMIAEGSKAGNDALAALAAIDHVKANSSLYFTVTETEHLEASGRTTGHEQVVQSEIKIKPVIGVVDGVPKVVSPERTQRSFNVMLSDIGEIVYLPRLIERLHRDAPGIRLTVRRLARPRVSEELASGRIDLAVGWVDRPSDVYRDELFMEDFVCIVRPKHPRIGQRLTLSQFASEWHLVVGRADAGPDVFLRATNASLEKGFSKAVRERKVALLVPHFLAVPNIIANTDLVCVVPRQLGQVYEAYGQVRIVALPVKCESFAVSQFWHKRFDADQGNVWLRAQVRDLFCRRTKT